MGNCVTKSPHEERLEQVYLQESVAKQDHEDALHSIKEDIHNGLSQQTLTQERNFQHIIQLLNTVKDEYNKISDELSHIKLNLKVSKENQSSITQEQLSRTLPAGEGKGREGIAEEVKILARSVNAVYEQQQKIETLLKKQQQQDLKADLQSVKQEMSLMNEKIEDLKQQQQKEEQLTNTTPGIRNKQAEKPSEVKEYALNDAINENLSNKNKRGSLTTEDINLVVVGEKGVGKETLLDKFASKMAIVMGTDKTKAVNGKYTYQRPYKDNNKDFSLLSISGEEDNKKRRTLCYWEANVFLICYSLANRTTFHSAEEKWIPEIKAFCTDNLLGTIPIVIVGTQANKRGSGASSVSREEGEQLAARVSAAGYIEGGIDQDSISQIFKEAYEVALSSKTEVHCVLVGDPAVGKESFLQLYAQKLGQTEEDVVNGRYTFPFPSDNRNRHLSLLSISGEENYKKRRQLCYWDAGLFIICFSVADRNSFTNAEKNWIPEVKSFCKENGHDIIIIVLGTELHKRKPGTKCVTEKEGKQLADRVSAASYIECHTTQEGASELIASVCKIYQETIQRQYINAWMH